MEGFSHEATLAMPEETYKINIEGTIIVHYSIIPLEFWEGSQWQGANCLHSVGLVGHNPIKYCAHWKVPISMLLTINL